MGRERTYDPNEDQVIRDFLSRLKEALGKRLRGVVLFGSRARGDSFRDSDYDVLILVDETSNKTKEAVYSISWAMMEDHEELFVPVVVSESRFRDDRWEPLFINIRNEGKSLYD